MEPHVWDGAGLSDPHCPSMHCSALLGFAISIFPATTSEAVLGGVKRGAGGSLSTLAGKATPLVEAVFDTHRSTQQHQKARKPLRCCVPAEHPTQSAGVGTAPLNFWALATPLGLLCREDFVPSLTHLFLTPGSGPLALTYIGNPLYTSISAEAASGNFHLCDSLPGAH